MGSTIARITGWRGSGAAVGKVNIKRPPVTKAAAKALNNVTLNHPEKGLLDRLKDVYVSSSDDAIPQENVYAADRRAKLSLSTTGREDGNALTSVPSRGCLGMKEISQILQHHQSSSKDEWTASRVAEVHGIDQADAVALLKYFMGYKVVSTFERQHPKMDLHHLHE